MCLSSVTCASFPAGPFASLHFTSRLSLITLSRSFVSLTFVLVRSRSRSCSCWLLVVGFLVAVAVPWAGDAAAVCVVRCGDHVVPHVCVRELRCRTPHRAPIGTLPLHTGHTLISHCPVAPHSTPPHPPHIHTQMTHNCSSFFCQWLFFFFPQFPSSVVVVVAYVDIVVY